MIDLHSHLLPGVDDGSQSSERSRDVLGAMARAGVTDVCLTPHLSLEHLADGSFDERMATHAERITELRAAVGGAVGLHYGAELMLDQPLGDSLRIDRRVCLGASRCVLVEFPRQLRPEAIRGLLRQVRERGLIPVVAHPERYPSVTNRDLVACREVGALVQVDATSLVTGTGFVGERARMIVAHGLADVLAADNHGDHRSIAAAFPFLEDCGATHQAELLLERNPQAILADAPVESVPEFEMPRPWKERLRGLLRPTWLPGGPEPEATMRA